MKMPSSISCNGVYNFFSQLSTATTNGITQCTNRLVPTTLTRKKKLTLICIPITIITILLLSLFTSSESAALSVGDESPLNDPYHFPFNFTYIQPSYPKSPKVFLKLNGEFGMLRRPPPSLQPQNQPQILIPAASSSYEQKQEVQQEASRKIDDDRVPNPIVDIDVNADMSFLQNPTQHPEFSTMQKQEEQDWNNYKHWSDVSLTTESNLAIPITTMKSRSISKASKEDYSVVEQAPLHYKSFYHTAPAPPRRHFSSYSEEDLENLALQLDDDDGKYFIKTKPRDVASSLATASPPAFNRDDDNSQFSTEAEASEYFNNPYAYTFNSNKDSSPAKPNEFTGSKSSDSYSPHLNQIFTTTVRPRSVSREVSQKYYQDSDFQDEPESREAVADSREEIDDDPIEEHTVLQSRVLPIKPATLKSSTSIETSVIADEAATTASNLISDVTSKYGSTDSTSIPGMPGIDYPIFGEIPPTSFDCNKQRYKGFFADVETNCQSWHYCDLADGAATFLCPNGTVFSQVLLTCDWWFNVQCSQTEQLYVLNERLYRYIKPPKKIFPEDYHGPLVDTWLREQLQLGLLPKVKRKGKDKLTYLQQQEQDAQDVITREEELRQDNDNNKSETEDANVNNDSNNENIS